jgi:hypothetical protein
MAKAKKLVFNYDSYAAVVDATLHPPSVAASNKADWQKRVNGGDPDNCRAKWYGWNNTKVPAIDKLADFFLVKGWDAGVKKMRACMNQIKAPEVMSVRRRQTWREEGAELSRERLYAGYEQFWRGRVTQGVNIPKRIRLVFDVCVNSAVMSEDMFWVGAAGVTLAEALTEAGHSVELVASVLISDYATDTTYRVNTIVKAFDQPFNYSTTLAITGHAAYFRQVILCHQRAYTPTLWAGCGSPRRFSIDRVDSTGVEQILISHMTSAEQANSYVAETIAELETPANAFA